MIVAFAKFKSLEKYSLYGIDLTTADLVSAVLVIDVHIQYLFTLEPVHVLGVSHASIQRLTVTVLTKHPGPGECTCEFWYPRYGKWYGEQVITQQWFGTSLIQSYAYIPTGAKYQFKEGWHYMTVTPVFYYNRNLPNKGIHLCATISLGFVKSIC